MQRLLIIGGGLVVLSVLVLGANSFLRGNKTDDLIKQKTQLQGDLSQATGKLNQEKSKLNSLLSGFKDSFTLAIGVQDEIKRATNLVAQTNFLFTDPESLNPELKFKNPLSSILINQQRKEVNLLIMEWQKKTDILSVRKIDIKESEQIRKDAETIKTFIKYLTQIVDRLTPENSGLSQFQIDTYAAQLPSVESINEVLISLQIAIDTSNTNNPNVSNTNTSTSQTSVDLSSDIPFVTPEEIILEQAIVAEAQMEVSSLQEQLVQVEQQIQQSYSTPTPTPSTPVVPPDPVVQTPTGTITDTVNNFSIPFTRDRTNYQGVIIIQPGPPRLIQGTDPY